MDLKNRTGFVHEEGKKKTAPDLYMRRE